MDAALRNFFFNNPDVDFAIRKVADFMITYFLSLGSCIPFVPLKTP